MQLILSDYVDRGSQQQLREERKEDAQDLCT